MKAFNLNLRLSRERDMKAWSNRKGALNIGRLLCDKIKLLLPSFTYCLQQAACDKPCFALFLVTHALSLLYREHMNKQMLIKNALLITALLLCYQTINKKNLSPFFIFSSSLCFIFISRDSKTGFWTTMKAWKL